MKSTGRPLLGALAGLFLGIGVVLFTVGYGIIALDSNLLVVLPIICIVLGIANGWFAPLGSHKAPPRPGAAADPPAAPAPAPDPEPEAE